MAQDNSFGSSLEDELKLLFNRAVDSDWFKQLDIKDNHFKKGQILFAIGQKAESILFVKKGSIRAYYYDQNNKEQTFYVWDDYSIVTDIVHFIENIPTDLFFEICDDTTIFQVPKFSIENVIGDGSEQMKFLFDLLLFYTTKKV